MYKQYKSGTAIILICTLLCGKMSKCQTSGVYPLFTKWYQDPLGLRPLELSSAFGFVWGATSIAACLILAKKDTVFQKHISIYQETGFSFGYKPPYTAVFQQEAGLLYDVRKWMALGLGFTCFQFNDKINKTWSFGIRPFARWYPYKSKKVNLFFEYGAGISYTIDRFPLTGTGLEADTARTGTRFNFTTKYGIGAEFHFSKNLSLQTSARHFHLSNGNLAGIQRNPSHDSNSFFAGIVYTPKNRDCRKPAKK